MRIERFAGPATLRGPKVGRGGFRAALGETGQADATAPAAVLPPVIGLHRPVRDRADTPDETAHRHADALLGALDRLQIMLLDGPADDVALERLVVLAEGARAEDPRLAAIMAAVLLRARVELARRETTTTTALP